MKHGGTPSWVRRCWMSESFKHTPVSRWLELGTPDLRVAAPTHTLKVPSVTPEDFANRWPPAQLQLLVRSLPTKSPREASCCPAWPWKPVSKLRCCPLTPRKRARASDTGWVGDLKHPITSHLHGTFIPRPSLHTHHPISFIIYNTRGSPPPMLTSLGRLAD